MQTPWVPSLRIAVLGPLDATVDGTPVDLGPKKQRAVLGVLAALAPAAVSVERLVDEIWGDGGPANPLRSLQVYVSSLRSALGPYGDRLVTEGKAYRLLAGAEHDAEIDAEVFRQLGDISPQTVEQVGIAAAARRAELVAARSNARSSAVAEPPANFLKRMRKFLKL